MASEEIDTDSKIRERVRYFAFGSNMSTARLRARAPLAQPTEIGCINGYDLRFHKAGVDGSGKADAFRTGLPGDVVWGVLFDLTISDLAALDKVEGVGRGYERVAVDVSRAGSDSEPGDSVERAWIYLAEESFIDKNLQPYTWYKRYVVEGAREHGLPGEYIGMLESVTAITDPNPGRAARHASP